MTLSSGITLAYAILLIIGGVMGYIKAGSLASLAMGTLFGCALLGCWWASCRQINGSKTATLVLTAVLACFFGYRLAITGSFLPAGALLVFSILILLVLLSERCCCMRSCKDAPMKKS